MLVLSRMSRTRIYRLRGSWVGLLVLAMTWLACGKPSRQEGGYVVESLGGPVARIEQPTHGFLGIMWDPKRSMTVAVVAPGTSAAARGVLAGDVITSIEGRPVTNGSEALAVLKDFEPGDEVELELLRGGASMSLRVELTTYADFTARLETLPPSALP